MGSPQVTFDTEIFERSAAFFAVKRDALAPDAVEALATDIVRRIAGTRSQWPAFDTPEISGASIAAFCDALIQPKPQAALRFIEDRRAEGVTRQSVYLGYITGAARHLGELWDEDEVSFVDVTIGTGHLYALMRALRTEGPSARAAPDRRRRSLFATVPGEQHGLGITVAAELFREAGWEIDLQTGSDHDSLIAVVEETQPNIIGLSFSTDERLDALVRLVVAIRLIVPQAIIGVAPGSGVDAERLRSLVDIDLLFEDARSAFRELDRLIRHQG